MMKRISILSYNQQSIGVRVIVDAFLTVLREKAEVKVAHSLLDIDKDGIIIPYGPKETYDVLKCGINVPLSLMVDYHTLSLKNRSLFLLKNGYFLSKSLLHSSLAFFLYYFRENYIFKHCRNFMFVSQYDIEKVKNRFPKNRYFCVPNGVNVPKNYQKMAHNDGITLGILSGWTQGTFIEAKWFIDKYWPTIVDHNPKVKLIICGKFASKEMIDYFNNQPNVSFIGEVKDLSEFFDGVDIYVATKPIGCGILNKVLDAMAYKTLVVGISQSFTGFTYMTESYVICDKLEDYINLIDSYSFDRTQYDKYIENAYQNILKYNDWDRNYQDFIKSLMAENIIEFE